VAVLVGQIYECADTVSCDTLVTNEEFMLEPGDKFQIVREATASESKSAPPGHTVDWVCRELKEGQHFAAANYFLEGDRVVVTKGCWEAYVEKLP
jgi:hypothetical protein